MNCSTVRESISASLDSEESAMSSADVSLHLASCRECATWSAAANDLHRQMRVMPAPKIPDLTAEILATIELESPRRRTAVRDTRVILSLCAVVQLLACIPVLTAADGGAIHLDHELGASDAALAVGLLVAAISPARAWGMLPLVAAIAGFLTLTALIDAASGHTSFSGESAHLLEIIGLFFLWNLARLHKQSRLSPALGLV